MMLSEALGWFPSVPEENSQVMLISVRRRLVERCPVGRTVTNRTGWALYTPSTTRELLALCKSVNDARPAVHS